MTKAFSAFLVVALVFGGMLGGAFAGGVVLGKTQEQESAGGRGPGRISADTNGRASGGLNRNRGGGPREGAGQQGAGDRFQGGLGDVAEGRGSGRGGQRGVFGTIESVEGNQITLQTPQGQVHVTVSPDTTIQRTVEGSMEDLKTGARVRVRGPRGEDGNVQARAITLVPERADEIFGQGGRRGGR